MSNGNAKNLGQTLYFSQFGGERPIPEAFIAAMSRAEERTSGYAADAEVPQDIIDDSDVVEARFDTSERRTNEKVLVVVRKKPGNITLRDFRTTDQGLSVQVDSTLFYTTDSTFVRTYPSVTQDVAIKDLGNGWSIQEVAVSGVYDGDGNFIPTIYQSIELATRRDDPVPAWARTGLPETEVQSVVEGTVVQPTLAADDLTASERQLAESKKLLSRVSRDPITLPKNEKFSKEIDDLLPARFRGLIPTTRQSYIASGNVSAPTLAAGDLVRTEEQVTALVKLVEIISRAGVTFPVVVIDTAVITEYGGGPVNITSTVALVNTLTVEEGEGIVSSKVTKLGEGHELKETVARQNVQWPTLPFARFDAKLQILITGTKQVVAKGSTTAGFNSGTGVITEIQDIDGYREWKILTTQPIAAVDGYFRILPGNTTNVDVPPVLVSLNGYVDLGGGAGSYSENGNYSLSTNIGGGNIQLHGSAQASAVAIPELGWVVLIPRTSNIPAIHVVLYVPNSSSRATIVSAVSALLDTAGFGTCTDWPNFRPQPITVKGVGGKVNIQTQVSVNAHDSITTDYLGAQKFWSNSRSSGAGVSYDVGITTKIWNIPATIHGSLSIDGTPSASTPDYAAQGVINGGVISAGVLVYSSTSGALAIISSAGATTGNTSFSGLGLCVHRLISEPDIEFNRVRVLAEVVNFADITP